MPPTSSSRPARTEPPGPWPGCLGVRLRHGGAAEAYGTCRGVPLLEVAIEEGHVGTAGGEEIWRLQGEVEVSGRTIAYDQRLLRMPDGSYVVCIGDVLIRAEREGQRVVLQGASDDAAKQVVTTYALPVLLNDVGVLQLHASAAVPPSGEGAYLVCGSSGTGKSSLLIGLIDAGWRAVCEDISVVDQRAATAVVWPGPPWARRDGAGPRGAKVSFRTLDKTAWDITQWRVDAPVPVAGLVFLEPAGGLEPELMGLESSETIRRTLGSAMWLIEPSRRAGGTFGPVVRLSSVGGTRLKLPRSDDWIEHAASLLASVL